MIDLSSGWPWLDKIVATAIVMVIAFTPFQIMQKLDRIIALLEQIARKD